MVSIFPPSYGLAPIFNIAESAIVDILENGYSEAFYNKAKKLLEKYNNSLGIDEHKIPFVKLLQIRVKELEKIRGKKVYFEDELYKALTFLESVVKYKEKYFLNHINKGRKLKKTGSNQYSNHKMLSMTYTPFGVFKSRENKGFVKSSNYLYFDVDIKLDKEETKKIIRFFLDDPYIKTSWLSFSGSGFGFSVKAKWKDEIEMKKVYYKLLEYFNLELQYKYNICKRVFDTQVCSLSRMNVISYGLITNKKVPKEFILNDYSDGLFSLLRGYYKKDSFRSLPNRELTEDDFIRIQKVKDQNLKNQKKTFIADKENHENFLEMITNSIGFRGSDDYNGTIKDFVAKVFRYRVDEDLIEDFLFTRIPRTNGAEKNYKRLWQCFSGYSEFRTVEPFVFKKL